MKKNLPTLARILAEKGLRIAESRIVGDSPANIAAALNDMRRQCGAVFTSGGIGPTHDDVTIDGVAAAFAVPVIYHPHADKLLADFYVRHHLPYTAARRRMARAPQGADILQSRFDGAPGFAINHVFICAGVPTIFAMMAEAAAAHLPTLPPCHAMTLRVDGAESELAEALEKTQAQWTQVEMGSYPQHDDNGPYCHLVFASTDAAAAAAALNHMRDYLESHNMSARRADD